jgi:hypothetical protein
VWSARLLGKLATAVVIRTVLENRGEKSADPSRTINRVSSLNHYISGCGAFPMPKASANCVTSSQL